MGEHALDLRRLEPLPEAGRDGDSGVLRVAAGGERVRDVAVDHGDLRLRQVGHRAEPLDHVVQLPAPRHGSTTFAPDASSASLSEVKYCNSASPPTITTISTRPTFRT